MSSQGKRVRNNRGNNSPQPGKQRRINSAPRKVSFIDKLKTDDKFKKYLKRLLKVDSDISNNQLKGYTKKELLDMLLLQYIIKDHTNELNNLIKEMKALKLELDLYKYEYRNNTNLAGKVDVTAERLTHLGLTPNVTIYDRLKRHLNDIDNKIKVANTMIEAEIQKEYNNSKTTLENYKKRKDKLTELTTKLNTLQTQHSSLMGHAHSTILHPQQTQQLRRHPRYTGQLPVSSNTGGPLYGGSLKRTTKKKSTTTRKKKTSTPKKHKGPRGGIYIIRKGRKIYQ